MIRVLLADDHPMILRGLRDLFNAYSDLSVVGEVTDGSDVVDSVAQLAPDVLVLDYVMPGANATDIIAEVAAAHPSTRIIVLSMHSDVSYVWEALKNGALGYVLKCADDAELVNGVRAVHAGRRYLSAPLSEASLDEYVRQLHQQGAARLMSLTKRELEVLKGVAEGRTSSEIAEQLGIGRRTVETHRASLLGKLGLRNQLELVRYAFQRGIVGPD